VLPDDPAGLYGPDSMAWRLNREAMLLLAAGPRALLMQIAHPLVAAGVDEHSDFRADPWSRLRGTLHSYLRIVYGNGSSARSEIRRLNALHRVIQGPGYSARDPELSLWVHATLVDSTIAAYEAWLEPLTRSDAAGYYGETLPIGRAFGIPAHLLPTDLEAFESYMERMLEPGSPVAVGPVGRELARHVLRPTLAPLWAPLGAVPPGAYAWTLWPAIGLLPDRVRTEFGLSHGPLERAVSAWLVAGWRGWRPLLPAGFRQMPQALAADRRMAGRVP
jgi:uncharacterized protein (DUF2236 family)